MTVKEEIMDYICDMMQSAAECSDTEGGISPRGALALCRIAKAGAFLDGRDHVVPKDIRTCLILVCAHRLVLTREAKAAGKTPEGILDDIIKKLPYPENREDI